MVASYHLSVKTVSRAHGRSATAAAAYRSADRIHDATTDKTFDYTRKRGVEHSEIVLPEGAPEWAKNREQLWSAAEEAEKRRNSTVAREFEIALPAELNAQEREALARGFARELVERHGFAADVAIHAPHREGDQRNHHAHILVTTRRLGAEGFTEKTRELDEKNSGEVVYWRGRWADLQNEYLKTHGQAARVDHRSLENQGIEREPTWHKGPAITAMERRGIECEVSWRIQEEANERLAVAAEAGVADRREPDLSQQIVDTETELAAALHERNVEWEARLTRQAHEALARWEASRKPKPPEHTRSAGTEHEVGGDRARDRLRSIGNELRARACYIGESTGADWYGSARPVSAKCGH
ncbi:MAG TPA: MobQ family relaxase [Steroidobacteraceae bacterium]